MGKNCIVQIDIHPDKHQGNFTDISVQRYNEPLIDHSIRAFDDYCKHIGCDHIVYKEQKWPQYHPQVELFRVLYDLKYKHYDFIAVVDVDVIPNTGDSIFSDCSIDHFNYVEPNPHEKNMFNSGVVVFGKNIYSHYLYHHSVERAAQLLNTDQQELQMLMDLFPETTHRIPNRWNNYMDIRSLDGFIHFKGGWKTKYYPQFKSMLQ